MSKQKEKDPRFKAVNSDPRFHTIPKKEQKVQLDDRFRAIIDEKEKFDHADEFYYVETEKHNDPKPILKNSTLKDTKNQVEEIEHSDDAFESEDEQVVRGEQSSSRLAIQNCDWNHLNAKNIFMLFRTLTQAEFSTEFSKERVKRVEIYLSDFGQQQLEIESIEGPRAVLEKALQKTKGAGLDQKILRKYEKERLRYYYAIVQFDTTRTAEKIYENYDGLELELSGCKLDLRFVPEMLDIKKNPTEICNGLTEQEIENIPKFINTALGHSNVELTWDAPIDRNIDDYVDNATGELDSEKIKDMIALSEDDHDEIEHDTNDIRGQLLTGTNIYDDFNKGRKRDKDITITFKVGFGEDDEFGNGNTDDQMITKRKEYRMPNERKTSRQLINQSRQKKFDKKQKVKEEEGLELLIGEGKESSQPFEINLKDERFEAMGKHSKFAIDPTDPRFKEKNEKFALDRKKKISK